MPKVFISHSVKDRAFVQQNIINLLRSHGIDTWYSADDIPTAEEWERVLLRGLKDCDYFLVVMSPHSAQSEWVRREVFWAFNKKRRIIPVLMEDCDPDDFHIGLYALQNVDFCHEPQLAAQKLLKVFGLQAQPLPPPPSRWVIIARALHAYRDKGEAGARAFGRLLLRPVTWLLPSAGIICQRVLESVQRVGALKHATANAGALAVAVVVIAYLVSGGWNDSWSEHFGRVTVPYWIMIPLLGSGLVWCGYHVGQFLEFPFELALAALARRFPRLYALSPNLDRFLAIGAILIICLTGSLFVHRDARYSSLLSKASAANNAGQYSQAISIATEAILLRPGQARAYLQRAHAYSQIGDYDHALTDYDATISLDPKNAEAYANRGNMYRKKDDLDKAIADCTKALELAPRFAWASNIRGLIHKQKMEYDQAIADYSQALGIDPAYVDVYVNRAEAHQLLHQFEQALADCAEAIHLEPLNGLHYATRASIYLDMGDPDKAIADCTQALELNPRLAWACNLRGVAHHRKNEPDLAIADYTAALAINSAYVVAYTNRAAIYETKGNYDQAIVDYSAVLQLEPQNAKAYAGRGWNYYEKNQPDLAIVDWNKAVEYATPDSGLSWVWRYLGKAFAQKGQNSQALTNFQMAITQNRNQARDVLGDILRRGDELLHASALTGAANSSSWYRDALGALQTVLGTEVAWQIVVGLTEADSKPNAEEKAAAYAALLRRIQGRL